MADTYVVKNGDTLWSIAKDKLGAGSKYQELAKWNNISNPDHIVIGQVLTLKKTTSSTTTHNPNSKKVTIKSFGLQANVDRTLLITWAWSRKINGKETTDHYKYQWRYYADGIWFIGDENTTENKYSTYTIPDNAKKVDVRIKPIAKYTEKDGKKTYKWDDSQWTARDKATFNVSSELPPEKITATIDVSDSTKYQLIAKIKEIDLDPINPPTHVKFRVIKNNTSTYNIGTAKINKGYEYVSYSCNLEAGYTYKVQCKAVRGDLESDWSSPSDDVVTPPAAPAGFTICRAESKTSVYLKWKSVRSATGYEIEYTDDKNLFDKTNVQTASPVDGETQAIVKDLETGKEYFFRLRATNKADEPSPWSKISSTIIGSEPSMPTTWSSTTTVVAGEPLTLNWIHNSVDGSSQTKAEVRLYFSKLQGVSLSDVVGGESAFGTIGNIEVSNQNYITYVINNQTNEDERDKTSWLKINTSKFNEGAHIEWVVRTKGITDTYSEWSTQRKIDIYAPPTLELNVTDKNANAIETLISFPLYISGLIGSGTTQKPISYHIAISANESYEGVNNVGNDRIISAGDIVYSKYFDIGTINEAFDTSKPLVAELSAGDLDLENGISYTVKAIVSMDSGLTAESETEFYVSWTDETYLPGGEVGIDEETLVAHIRPYCTNYKSSLREVGRDLNRYILTNVLDESVLNSVYTTTNEEVFLGIYNNSEIYYCVVYTDSSGKFITPVFYTVSRNSNTFTKTTSIIKSSSLSSVFTLTGEEVLLGVKKENGVDTYINYAVVDESESVNNIKLSVYRREFDGGFTELATDIDNLSNTFITDPHPALDYARYRIVARSESTGAISYYDLPGVPVGGKSIVIQWDEDWSSFDTPENGVLAEPAWVGSMLKLHYNIDISDNNQGDVELVEYIGRSHPVGYYGTQVGQSSTWNVDIEKSDEETLYALRRLSRWMGNVYVREPSGSGYWASISVSFSQKHLELTIPVTINVTRVEGGA